MKIKIDVPGSEFASEADLLGRSLAKEKQTGRPQ